ncbi:DUF2306 domain-containing protein [Ovoidimarina sediminis]|uniref:DUF2306 domain-containing protein n=1 Tax=Ovoidimarina sediminis TaxID=3079856 RepID=UPI00290FD214|nr:DUF2306 domain-containing protein [Rhodophyticola sp. MJ-SS7]MDU8943880.1 DUF2306 domain-containing protein [Rhodophyticola sp. MJ-SS7]
MTDTATTPARRRVPWLPIGIGLLIFLMAGFIWHAITFGLTGLFGPLPDSYLYRPGGTVGNGAMSLHMILGGLITLIVSFQLLPGIRARRPALHRAMGRGIVLAAFLTAAFGLTYIALRGTKGGPVMDAGSILYGLLTLLAAVQTFRHARARDIRLHREWALRLFVLIVASWAYRFHYALWYIVTGGLWSELPGHTGPFDLVQNFAFYLVYLALLELWFMRERRGRAV